MRKPFPLFTLALASYLTLSVSDEALAQEGEQSALDEARANFQRALELEHAQDYSGALKLFRKVGQVKMTPQVRYHIAGCEEHLGKLVNAMGGYKIALSQAGGMHPEFIAEIEASIQDLNARIPKLVLTRGSGAEGAIIELDGVELGAARIGEEIIVDPGPHSLVATARGKKEFATTLTLQEGAVENYEVQLEELPAPEAPELVQKEATPQGYGPWPYILGGSGIAVAGLGGAFLGISQGKVKKAEDICGPIVDGVIDCTGVTDPEEREQAESYSKQATTFEALGWAGIGVGVASVAAGTVLYFIDPTRGAKAESKAGVSFKPSAPRANVGFSLQGRF
ncbi:MAG: hypothetical protein MK135_04440 [Polyangiaceae bacterium]|nr:hypothetical protein [Polyangiaceae bacterium]